MGLHIHVLEQVEAKTEGALELDGDVAENKKSNV